MSVEELQTLHQRYVALSQRFRSAWVFHQFLQSLAKLYFDDFDDRYPDRFQELYGQLKEISQSLNASQAAGLGRRFDGVERQLSELIDALMAEDSRVEPAHLRRFFRRFRTYDEKVLLQLVRFYLYAHRGDSWSPDRLDKVDYLLTRLSEEGAEDGETSAPALAESARLREVLTSLRTLIPAPPAPIETIEERRREIERLRDEIAAAGDLERLHERALVQRFRALKHGLGELFFEPDLAVAVLETNRRVKGVIKELYGREERRIFAEYQQIFDLEGQVRPDRDLSADLTRFREEVERFERHLQRDEMRLDELAQIRKRVRALMPRLTAGAAGAAFSGGGDDASFEDLGDATLRPGEAAAFQAAAVFESTDPTPYHDGASLHDVYPADDFSAAAAEAVGEATGEAVAEAPPPRPEPAPAASGEGDESLIQDHFGRLVEALDGTTLGAPPKAVSLTPDVYQFKLEPREVIAYRRLLQRGRLFSVSPPDEGWDEALERFILRAASLRVRMNEEAEEIRGILDETVSDVGSPVFQRSRRTVRLGDAYLARFAHLVHQLVLDSQAEEARELELLRIRLMHEYSGLWLLSYRQAITERAVAEAG
jgi:hypothetical protein